MKGLVSDFTRGSIKPRLIRFAIPFLLSNLIQTFYNIADIKIVSMFCGANGIAGVSIAGNILNTVTYMIIGLCNGGAVMTAQYIGAGSEKDVKETIGTTFAVMIALTAVTTALALVFSDSILSALNTPPEAFGQAKAYFMICMSGSVFIYGYNAIGAILRGVGNSKTPMYFGIGACLMNVGLDLLLVGPGHMDAAGAAVATAASQAAAMIACAVYLKKSGFIFGFSKRDFKFSFRKAADIFRLGLPGAVQNAVVSGGFLMVSSLTNSLGVNAASGVSVASKINNLAQQPASAVGMAVASMTGQNVGAGFCDRAREAFRTAVWISLAVGAAAFVTVQLIPEQLMGLIVSDKAVIEEALPYLRITALDYLLVAMIFPLNGICNGSGHTLFTMIPSVVSSVVTRVPAAYLCVRVFDMGLAGVGISTPVGTVSAILICGRFYLSGRWQKSTIKLDRKEI